MSKASKNLVDMIQDILATKYEKKLHVVLLDKLTYGHLDFFNRDSKNQPFDVDSGKESGDYKICYIDTSDSFRALTVTVISCHYTSEIGIFSEMKEETYNVYEKARAKVKKEILNYLNNRDKADLISIFGEPADPEPGRAEEGEKYFYNTQYGYTVETTDTYHTIDDTNFKSGNYYLSREEAEAALEKQKNTVEYKSKNLYSAGYRVGMHGKYFFIEIVNGHRRVSETTDIFSATDLDNFRSGNYYLSRSSCELAINFLNQQDNYNAANNKPAIFGSTNTNNASKNPYNNQPLTYYVIKNGTIFSCINTGTKQNKEDLSGKFFKTKQEAEDYLNSY